MIETMMSVVSDVSSWMPLAQDATLLAQDAAATGGAVSGAAAPAGAAGAAGAAGGPPPPGWFQFLSSFGPIILIFVVFWWFITSSKKRQDRERANMLSAMKKGDRVQMIGGEIGHIVETKEDRVLIKVDENSNTKIWYARDAIAKALKE